MSPFGLILYLLDSCVLINSRENLIVAVYLGDIVLFGEQDGIIDNLKPDLKSEFKVSDMGNPNWLFEIQIECSNTGISLSYTAHIDTVPTIISIQDCKLISIPI